VNKLAIYGLAGVLGMASLTGNFVQARIIGEQKATAKVLAQRVVDGRKALKQAGEQLKDYQDGNVLSDEEAARLCRASALAAYDAGVMRGQRSVAERQAAGAFVPGQRAGGSPK
jgi:hypothetical protein